MGDLRGRCLAGVVAVLALACGPVTPSGEDADSGWPDGVGASGDDATTDGGDGGDALDAAPSTDADAMRDGGVEPPNDAGQDGGAEVAIDGGHDAGVGVAMDGGHDAGIEVAMDGGHDAGVEVAMDGGHDAGVEVAMDGGHDAGVEVAMDGGHDAGVEVAMDAGHDAGVEVAMDGGHDAGVEVAMDGGHDAGVDKKKDAGVEVATDGGHDAGGGASIDGGGVDRCLGVICPGTACRTGSCEPATGACVAGAPRADGSACSDGNACTTVDWCRDGDCFGGYPVSCAPEDACHEAGLCDPASGVCTSAPRTCRTEVLVRVRDARGAILAAAAIVRAFVGTTAQPQGGVTDAAGEIRMFLPDGSYRFRAQRDGLPFWSGATNHCTTPGCTFVEMRLPDTTLDRVVSWDPPVDGTYDDHGEIFSTDPHILRGGVYLENWAVLDYGLADASLSGGHTHLAPRSWEQPDPYGDPTYFERQHAYGSALHGIFVRLDTHGPFDLVSIDYRVRGDDGDPTHVSTIPGASPADVEIWISSTLTLPAAPFHRYSTGRAFTSEMTYWSSLLPTDVTNVTGVFITTTGNVSLDNVVVRPR